MITDGVLSFTGHEDLDVQIESVHLLYQKWLSDQDDFGYVDLYDWTSLKRRVNCTQRDAQGIHFRNDNTRMIHVQELINFMSYYSKRRGLKLNGTKY